MRARLTSHSQGRPAAGSMVFPSEAEVGPELRRAAGVQPVQVEDWKCLERGSAGLPFPSFLSPSAVSPCEGRGMS